jgi:hypothetical protein
MADDATIPKASTTFDWDFFLAHAGPDLDLARNLKRALEPPAKTFLDDENLTLGDDFDRELAEAQQSSLISVVIVSPHTEEAYYQREEIAAAIQMSREDPHTHRVVPIFFNQAQIGTRQIPYGLRLKHSLKVADSTDLTEAGKRLLETLKLMKHYEEKKVDVVAEQRAAITTVTSPNANALAAVPELTRFVGPLLKTLLVMFVLVVLLLIACLLLPYFAEVRALLATVLGSLCALLLASMLWLTARSFSYAQQIAQGRINGG